MFLVAVFSLAGCMLVASVLWRSEALFVGAAVGLAITGTAILATDAKEFGTTIAALHALTDR